jgi:hypothetical protein
LLRGAGVALGLPLLEQMLPGVARAQASGAPPVRRFVGFFVPCGMNMKTFTPTTVGTAYTLSPALAPLSTVKQDVLVLSNLSNRTAIVTGGGNHMAGTSGFLCPYTAVAGTTPRIGVSIDQMMAEALRPYTPRPSLELGPQLQPVRGSNCGGGYSCSYLYNVSWRTPSVPAARIAKPSSAFDSLFPNVDKTRSQADRLSEAERDASVLDAVMEDTARLQARLGTADQQKVDEYLTGVRELEVRTRAFMDAEACAPPSKYPSEATYDIDTWSRLMLEYIVTAFQCDQTRVATLMTGGGGDGSGYNFPFLGIKSGHHSLSHHLNDAATLAQLTRVDAWEVSLLAHLVQLLKDRKEADGKSLLESTVVYMSSELADGNTHTHIGLPVLIAGHGGGKVRPGRHVRFATEQPLANLHLSLLDVMGIRRAALGDSTGPLSLV